VLRSATVIGAPGEVRRWRFWVLCVNLRWSMYSACTTNSNRHTAEDQRAAISVYYGEALGIENQQKVRFVETGNACVCRRAGS